MMNKYFFVFLLFPLFFIDIFISHHSLASESKKLKQMSLAEAIALALRQNRTVENAYLNRILEKFDLIVAQDEFNPQVNFTIVANQYADYNEFRKNHTHTLTKGISSDISLKLRTGGQLNFSWDNRDNGRNFNNFNTGVQLSFSQPLLKGAGVDIATVNQLFAERNEQQNLLNLKATLMSTITEVIKTYRNFLLSQHELEILDRSMKRSQQQFEITQALIKAGRRAKMDSVQAEVDLANQEFDVRASKNLLDKNRLALLKILNMDKDIHIEPVEELDIEPVELDAKMLKIIVLNNKISYLSEKLSLKNARTDLMLAENEQLWDLNFLANYTIAGTGNTLSQAQADNFEEGDYSVGLSLVIPFRDLSRKQRLLSARVALQRAKNNFVELQDDIETNIQDWVRDIGVEWEQLKRAKRSRELTKQQLEFEMEKFKMGYEGTSNFQIIQFQDDLVAAENRELNAKISYLNALTDLDEFLGTTLETWGVDIESQREINLP